jgi:ATP-dependent protease HslVU (ClpYQ) peptidase subunit
MSVAVGVESEGGVWLAADSAISEDGAIDLACSGKLIKRAGYGVATVGYARAADVLQHYLDLPGPVSDEHVMSWAVTSLVPALQTLAEDHEPWKGRDDDDDGWSLIVAACGVVLTVGADYAVHRSQRGYQAIGTGAAFALGSLHATHPLDARNRCVSAVKAAATWCTTVREPVDLQWVPA